MKAIAINGRFLTQGTTGVQRFAREVTSAIDRLAATGEWPQARVLHPPLPAPASYEHLTAQACGRRSGQLWEQLELPRAARRTFLLNLGNTAPLLHGPHQAVVIHDAGVFDTPESYSAAFRLWYRLMQKRLARAGALLLTVSEFSRGRIAEHLGIERARIAVLPEGGEHMLRAPADQAVLTRHGLQPGRFALAVGNPVAHKNLATLGAAAAVLAQQGMVLAAAGSADPGVYSSAGAPPDSVRSLGRVTDAELRALYESALCLVFPSRYEGFGLPPLEAMTCLCPVIAARAGAVPEVCGRAALWFEPGDAAGLAAALARLLQEPGLAAELRETGRARAARFTWDAAARALLRHLEAHAP